MGPNRSLAGNAELHRSLCQSSHTKGVPLLTTRPNYCVNLTRNGVAVAGLHSILARAIHTAAGRLHS